MGVVEDHLNIIELLAQHEEVIGKLYAFYAERFLDYEQFFLGLVEDEGKHAQWIRAVKDKVKEGSVIVNENRFPVETIQESIKDINNLITKAEELDVTLEEALHTTTKIEKGMIDRHFFEAFEGDPSALKNLLTSLRTGTEHHYQIAYEAWTRVRDSK